MSDEKIIVDDDWKSQVAAEKEAFNRKKSEKAPGSPGESPAAGTAEERSGGDDPRLPPASFELLVSTLASEAMLALGQIPNPLTGRVERRHNQAHYLIDTLEVLREKTQGNLAPEESQGLDDLLHQLRLAFVASGAANAGLPETGPGG